MVVRSSWSSRRARAFALPLALGFAGCARSDPPPDPTIHSEPPNADGTATPRPPRDARAERADASNKAACPAGMLLVAGSYCPEVRHVCLRFLGAPGPYQHLRCAEFKKPATCVKPREERRFCIDRGEYTEPGASKATVRVSWTEASALCEKRGARLCTEDEWQFACEGEEMRPYPYGFVRDSTICNFDKEKLGRPELGLYDLRADNDAHPRCVSPFGVHNMVGNVDEWAVRENMRAPQRSALRGGWWLPARNSCRAATYGHVESYRGSQVGFRCCVDP